MIGGDIWCDRVLAEDEVRRALSGAFRGQPNRIWLVYGMTFGDYLDLHDDTPPRESFDLFCVATVDAPEGFLFHLEIGVDGETTQHSSYLDRNDVGTFCQLAQCNDSGKRVTCGLPATTGHYWEDEGYILLPICQRCDPHVLEPNSNKE